MLMRVQCDVLFPFFLVSFSDSLLGKFASEVCLYLHVPNKLWVIVDLLHPNYLVLRIDIILLISNKK